MIRNGGESCTMSAKRTDDSIHATTMKERTTLNFVIPPAPACRGSVADLSRRAVEGPAVLSIPNEGASSTNNEGWVPDCPDFLWRLVALIHSMRLSLMKGAHADLSSTAWQEIGVKPSFWAWVGYHSTRF